MDQSRLHASGGSGFGSICDYTRWRNSVLRNPDTKSGSGHYFRDVRSAARTLETTNAQEAWEYVELHEMSQSDIGKVKCSINVYRSCDSPIYGVLQIICGQKKAMPKFMFDTRTGNEGSSRDIRPSPYWQDFDVAGLLDDLP